MQRLAAMVCAMAIGGACTTDGTDPSGGESSTTGQLGSFSWSQDIGVNQHSWSSPTLAALGWNVVWTHPGSGSQFSDYSIWYSDTSSVDASGTPLSYDHQIGGQTSNRPAAVAAFGTQFYMVHHGGGASWNDYSLWLSSEVPAHGWSGDYRLPFESWEQPVAISYNGRFYVAVLGSSGWALWSSTQPSSSSSWHPWGGIPMNAYGHPSFAVFNGLLYAAYGDGSGPPGFQAGGVSYVTFNGSGWSAPVGVPVYAGPATEAQDCYNSKPSLATFAGRLQLVHSGCDTGSGDTTSMWHLSFDGSSWTTDQYVPGHYANHGFSLAATPGALFVGHDSSSGNGLLYFAVYQ